MDGMKEKLKWKRKSGKAMWSYMITDGDDKRSDAVGRR